MDDFTLYTEFTDALDAAEDFSLQGELGLGDDHSGILLMLSMAERDYALFAFGYGNTAFTDYGKDYLSGYFLDNFKDNGWYNGFEDYQRVCGEMLDEARNNKPVDTYYGEPSKVYDEGTSDAYVGGSYDSYDDGSYDSYDDGSYETEDHGFSFPTEWVLGTIVCILLGLLVGLSVRLILHRKMKSVFTSYQAEAYVADGGIQLSVSTDDYTYTAQTRSYSPRNSDNDGAGGTTIRSSGGSGKSGKF